MKATQYTSEVNEMINEIEANIWETMQNEDFRTAVAKTAQALGIPAELWNSDKELRLSFYAYCANQIK